MEEWIDLNFGWQNDLKWEKNRPLLWLSLKVIIGLASSAIENAEVLTRRQRIRVKSGAFPSLAPSGSARMF